MKKAVIIFFFLFILLGGAPALKAQNDGAPAAPPKPETKEKQAGIKEPETPEKAEKKPKYEVQFHFSRETLSRSLGMWQTASLYVERKLSNRQLIWLNIRASDRNSVRDREFIAGTYKPFGRRWAMTAEAMFSPTHKFVGKYSLMGEVEKGFRNGFVLHGGARFTRYDTVKATTGYGIVEKYWGSNRAAYTLYVTKLSNAGTAPTHRIQYTRYYGERVNSVGAAFSFGREHENLGPNFGILRSQTWSVSVSARHWITKNFGLVIDGTIHRQGDIYYRRGVNIGVRYRF